MDWRTRLDAPFRGDTGIRESLITQFSAIGISCSVFYAGIHPLVKIHVPLASFLVLPVLLIINLVLLKKKRLSIELSSHFTILTLWLSFVVGIAYSGGIYSLVLPWLALMPIMALFLIDFRSATIWFVAAMLSILFFVSAFQDASVVADSGYTVRAALSLTGLLVVLFFFTHLFYKANSKMVNDLKQVNDDLLLHREEVQTQNEELVSQHKEILAQRDFIQKQNDLLVRQNKQIEHSNEQLRQRIQQGVLRSELLERHWHTLLEISKSRSINFGDFEEAMRYLTLRAADSLQTNRVSVWTINSDRDRLQCLILFDRLAGTHAVEEELLLRDFPRYFEALRKEDVIPADEASFYPDTKEFKKHYLEPRHIFSMMDTPYFIDGELGGVLCCEQTDAPRHWTPEDILFAQALADIVALAYRANQRREYERKIRQHRKDIVRMNQELESRVKARTHELENQNKQLAEYAYINSHLLRGPLSRILGLINLIEYAKDRDVKERELIEHLKQSGEELDDVVKKINEAIVDGNDLNRNLFGSLDQDAPV